MRCIDKFRGGNSDIFDLLAEFRQPKELSILFTSLPDGWEQRANDLQNRLYESFPQTRPKLIEIWLKSNTTPEAVYDLILLDSRVDYHGIILEPTR